MHFEKFCFVVEITFNNKNSFTKINSSFEEFFGISLKKTVDGIFKYVLDKKRKASLG